MNQSGKAGECQSIQADLEGQTEECGFTLEQHGASDAPSRGQPRLPPPRDITVSVLSFPITSTLYKGNLLETANLQKRKNWGNKCSSFHVGMAKFCGPNMDRNKYTSFKIAATPTDDR